MLRLDPQRFPTGSQIPPTGLPKPPRFVPDSARLMRAVPDRDHHDPNFPRQSAARPDTLLRNWRILFDRQALK